MNTIIELRNITKSYHLGSVAVPVLKQINLEIKEREFIALKGPSGSGKSTLLNLCGLLDLADTGRYRLADVEISPQSQRHLTQLRCELIGFIFQGFNLLPVMTVFENVEYPLLLAGVGSKQRRTVVNDMLARVGLTEFHRQRPDQLSGGQRQRVAVARALVKQPRLVIADEPTANLDGETASTIIDLMYEMSQESACTFLIATHDERMAKRCKRVIHLDDGHLIDGITS